MPLVTIVIACLNDLKHLPRAVESALRQTFSDIELIIVDGASSDGTVDYLRSLDDPRLTWRSERDGGITPAWNKAITLARGEWLMFLGADDYIWDNAVIARAEKFLVADATASLAFGEVCVVAEHTDEVVQRIKFDRAALLAQLRGPSGLGLPHQGFFHRRRALNNAPFDASFRLAADYEFISRFSSEDDFRFLPIGPVAAFRMGGLSTNPWATIDSYREFARIHRLRGRPALHGSWQISKAYAKVVLKYLLGVRIARRFINMTREFRNLPPYSG
jgi:glycosyltransferase involved in cell wall biosynthesis